MRCTVSRLALILSTALACFSSCIANAETISVQSEQALRSAVSEANQAGGDVTILLADGVYRLADTIYVNAPNITIAGASGDREKVVIEGDRMHADAKIGNLIRVGASGFALRHVTLQKSGWHLIQIAGEQDADSPQISDCVLRDSYQQLLKVSVDLDRTDVSSDNGLVENCLFEYSEGIGPQHYIGGIDAHAARNWVVRNNIFKSIISPSNSVAEYAVHFWNDSADNTVEGNLIVNCDRGIGFGLDQRGNKNGVIRNNIIYHEANLGRFSDVGIGLQSSPGTQVYNNTIFLKHDYPNSIEYRFAATRDAQIFRNISNRSIVSRDGGTAHVRNNIIDTGRGQPLQDFVSIAADTVSPATQPKVAATTNQAPYQGGTADGTEPLVQKNHLKHVGAFRVPHGGSELASLAYGGRAIAYNPANDSLFIVGHIRGQGIAEIGIPEIRTGPRRSDLDTATVVQTIANATEGRLREINPGDPNGQHIGGQLVYDDRLIISAFSFYDGAGTQRASHFSRPLSLTAEGGLIGPVAVGRRVHYTSAYMAHIPEAWQPVFGGPVLTGNCCRSVIGNQSHGPALSVFDPDDIGVENPVNAEDLLYYRRSGQLGPGDTKGNLVYNLATRIQGVLFPDGTRSVLFFGEHGIGDYCYGEGAACQDPANQYKGNHAFPYKYQVWAYDANELADAAQGNIRPDKIQPYAIWNIDMPGVGERARHEIGGVAYDAGNDRIFIAQPRGDGEYPLIHVFTLDRGSLSEE